LNSEEEAKYRISLAAGYLKRAEAAAKRKDHLAVISNSQQAVENSAKAVISCFRIPSWSHDPSNELSEVMEDNRDKIEEKIGASIFQDINTLALYSRNLAPEWDNVLWRPQPENSPVGVGRSEKSQRSPELCTELRKNS
jgi:HEPN domain-containing protein